VLLWPPPQHNTGDARWPAAGTLDYLAPEMLRNPSLEMEEGHAPPEQLEAMAINPYGPSIDVWAVGIIAYELVTGTAPFTLCDDEEKTMRRILDWHDIGFPRALSPQWADFVRCVPSSCAQESSLWGERPR
jgi:serine/threonine protein kinase